MKTKTLAALLLCVLSLIPPGLRAQTTNLTALLQQGLFEEQANRNLDAAIADYQALARQFDQDRQLAATAVFRLGECYRMQGKTNEAALEYQRIIRDFADQTQLATLSRQNLTGMGAGTLDSQTAGPKNSSNSTEAVMLATQLSAIEQLKTNPVEQARSVQALFPDDSVKRMLLNLPKLEKQEAEVKAGKTFQELGFFSIALGPDPISDSRILVLRSNAERDSTNLLADARAELQRQLAWISDRVNFIIQIQKAKLAVLQTVADSEPAPGGGPGKSNSAAADEEAQEIARIQTMIQNSPDLINAPVNGQTPLENAATHGWLKVAAYLLDHGVDVNARGGMALVDAAGAGNRAMVELLLSRGADVNPKENAGQIPIHVAVQNGFQAVVEVLLANKADVNAQNSSGVTPLFLAAGRDSPRIVSLLLEHKADVNLPDQAGATPLINAARSGQPENVKLLLAAGANPNAETSSAGNRSAPRQAGFSGRTALSFAAENGSPEMVKMFLAAKADPNDGKRDAPLLCAIDENDIASAELLLQAGAKPNAMSGFDLLRPPGFSGGRGGRGGFGGGRAGGPVGGFGGQSRSVTPLWLAISENEFPMVQLLLKYKADPNDSQTDGKPLLFSALSETNMLEALLDAGAKVDARDSTTTTGDYRHLDWTPLLLAVNNGLPATTVEILLKHGANPNARDGAFGQTAFHWMAGWGYQRPPDRKVLELLLDYKADPNVRNDVGQTPLDELKQWSVQASPVNGLPLDQKQKESLAELANLLRQHGALDVLPDWDRITVSRPSAKYSAAIFYKGTNDWNQFTLFDLLGVQYDLLTSLPGGVSRVRQTPYTGGRVASQVTFPDFSRIVIHRPPTSGTNWTELKINLAHAFDSGDCAGDAPLKSGDVVEIPEADHVINEPWRGLSTNVLFTLKNCLTRHLQITVNGQTTNLTVAPYVEPYRELESGGVEKPFVTLLTGEPFMIWPVLDDSKLLLASSDLSRVTVKRRDAATGKTREWTVDCSNPNSPPAFWLRDGDVIDVPERP